MQIKAGATSKSIPVHVKDTTSIAGAGLAGLAYNTGSLTAYYWRQGGSPTAISLATLAAINSAWSSGGFKEADGTNMKGDYRLDVPDAALATGADWVVIHLRGAANMAPVEIRIDLTGFSPQDSALSGADIGAATLAAAAATPIEANIKQINDAVVTGDGNGTPWDGA